MRLNLNTHDFSGESTENLLSEIKKYRDLESDPEDGEHYEDMADDIWSILYERGELDQDTLVELM